MTRPSVLAAHYAHLTGASFGAAAERYGATKQGTHRVYRKLYPDDVRAPGRRAVASPRRHSVRVPGLATVRLDDVEIAAIDRLAAGNMAAWFRRRLDERPCPDSVALSTHLRQIARLYVGLDS